MWPRTLQHKVVRCFCDAQVFCCPYSSFHSETTWIARETTCWAWRGWLRTSWQRSRTSWSLTWRAEPLNQAPSHRPTPLAPNLQATPCEPAGGRGRFQMCGNPLKALWRIWIPLRVLMLRLHAEFGEAADPPAPLREDELWKGRLDVCCQTSCQKWWCDG